MVLTTSERQCRPGGKGCRNLYVQGSPDIYDRHLRKFILVRQTVLQVFWMCLAVRSDIFHVYFPHLFCFQWYDVSAIRYRGEFVPDRDIPIRDRWLESWILGWRL